MDYLMKLTDTFVKRKQSNGKAQQHADGGGLFLYITPKGNKPWRMAYHFSKLMASVWRTGKQSPSPPQ
ncbi:MAG: Arm DNA-binding domain-containing protein [Deltaproteobacteria bacterium]|jgi:hypothetical protein|nr:Arm DNA-binding domain-containing protein [Deltaproteobacteria bacterium]